MFNFFKKKDHWRELTAKRGQCLTSALPREVAINLSEPLIDKNTLFKDLSFLVVDFETTGFEPNTNDIISMGWVEIIDMQIDLERRNHFYISNSQPINHETAVINHIVPQMIDNNSILLEKAIYRLLIESKNKILVVHGKVIEKTFLDYYAQTFLGIAQLPLMWIDTMKIEEWKTAKIGGNTISQDNRLSAVRKRYNLPQYAAHNALIDSVATAELLLAQISQLYRDRHVTLETLYEMSQ
jgi:DNA polymerase III subunit epsilon